MNSQELNQLIEGCQRGDGTSQKRLFNLFYNYAMSIGIRYTAQFEEAEEVVSDAFIKVFRFIPTHYTLELSFKAWLRRIIINTAIDRYRVRQNKQKHVELQEATFVEHELDVVERMTREQILSFVKMLPPQYKTVFNLYVVDGYTHPEIADMLNISEGASKSNLSRARMRLRELLKENAITEF